MTCYLNFAANVKNVRNCDQKEIHFLVYFLKVIHKGG